MDAAAARIKAAGGAMLSEPADRPWGARMFQFNDLDGFKLGVSTPLGDNTRSTHPAVAVGFTRGCRASLNVSPQKRSSWRVAVAIPESSSPVATRRGSGKAACYRSLVTSSRRSVYRSSSGGRAVVDSGRDASA